MSVVDESAVAALLARAKRDVDEGLLPSCQLTVALDGEVIAAATHGAPDDSRYVTFSVTKAFNAALAWLLIGDGSLSDQTRVADVLPAFDSDGKRDVTIEHLLTHTAGFPRAPMRPEEGADRERRNARFATWRLDWTPGTSTEYHATSAYWVLVEIIETLTGTDFRELFGSRIAGPLGLPGLTLGAAVGSQDDVNKIVACGALADGQETFGDKVKETGEGFLLRFNESDVMAIGVPGAGAVASATDVALFYQALLAKGSGVLDSDVVVDATTNVRNTMHDALFQCSANRTLGLVVAGDPDGAIIRGFGRSTSPRAFGAMGVGGQIAYADPDTGLSFSYLTNGLDVDVIGSFTRSAKIAGLAARCVNL